MKFLSRFSKQPRTTPDAYPDIRPYNSPTGGRRKTPVPDRIERFYVPLAVLQATSHFMRRFAEQRRECYAWWGGYFTDREAQVVTALCPDIQTQFGHIRLGTKELMALHNELRRLDHALLVELHSHPPGCGGQNDVDAAHPAATYPGFITIVVPDFGLPRFYDLSDSHVYEYIHANHWRQLTHSEIRSRFVIEEASLLVRP
jgi:hypothetical protein